jgi:hypothetical protein
MSREEWWARYDRHMERNGWLWGHALIAVLTVIGWALMMYGLSLWR